MPAIFRTIAAMLAAAVLAASVSAQEGDDQDYRKMLEQAMKSGNYSQSQSENWDARLKVISGSVLVKTVDNEEWSKVSGEMPLDPNDVVKTGGDGVAEVYLDDKGTLALGRNTELEISATEQADTIFTVNFGSLAAKIKHLLNDKFKMQVRTPSAVCAVRGTEFAVEYNQLAKETLAAVYDEGRLAVRPADETGGDDQEYTLEKNTEIVLSPAQKRLRAVPLTRMSRHRGSIAALRARLAGLKGWKPRSAEKRAALRDRALKRNVIRREIKDKNAVKKPSKAAKARAAARAKAKAAAARKAKAKAAQSYEEPEEE
jgi:hypothetical protein